VIDARDSRVIGARDLLCQQSTIRQRIFVERGERSSAWREVLGYLWYFVEQWFGTSSQEVDGVYWWLVPLWNCYSLNTINGNQTRSATLIGTLFFVFASVSTAPAAQTVDRAGDLINGFTSAANPDLGVLLAKVILTL